SRGGLRRRPVALPDVRAGAARGAPHDPAAAHHPAVRADRRTARPVCVAPRPRGRHLAPGRGHRGLRGATARPDLSRPELPTVPAPLRTDAGRERVALNTAYVRALTRAGLVPLVVPPILDPEQACTALDRVRGLVLTGGEDVAPARYHTRPHPKLGETDVARD